jgi:cytochrome c oxidase subunit 2
MAASPRRNGLPPGSIIAAVLIIITGLVTLIASLTVLNLPHSITEQGDKIRALYAVTLVISMVIYFGVTAAIICKGPELPAQIHGSSMLEVGWTIVPAIILAALFIPSLILMIDLKTPPPDDEVDLTVEAIAHQWWWEFNYPDDRVRIQATPPNYDDFDPPALVLPVGQTVVILVRSTDVIHSIYAPKTLYKIQAIPGNINQMHLKITKAGIYTGQCYQFCGLRHADMRFVIDAREPADFQRWLQSAQAAQGVDTSTENTAVTEGNR